MEDGVAGHLDLAAGAVGDVDLHGAVGAALDAGGESLVEGDGPVLLDALLQPPQDGGGLRVGSIERGALEPVGGEKQLELPRIPPPRRQHRVLGQGRGGIVVAGNAGRGIVVGDVAP